MKNENIKTYDAQASTLASAYNTVTTPETLPDFATHILSLPNIACKRALDVGCGSGRDAFWMAQQGLAVDAIDGSAEMLNEARTQQSHPLIHYIQDMAPNIPALQQLARKYDIVLMNAFLFHFDADERQAFYKALTPLLRPQSYVYVTLRHGPVPEGRTMYAVPLQELEDFAKAHNGASHYLGLKDDPLKRPGVKWDHVCLKLS